MSTYISPKLEPTTPSGNMTFDESDISDTSVCDDTEFTEMCVDDNDSDQCQWEPSCRKRGRTNSVDVGRNVKNVRGRRGKLSALPYVWSSRMPSGLFTNISLGCLAETCRWIFCTRSVLRPRTHISNHVLNEFVLIRYLAIFDLTIFFG